MCQFIRAWQRQASQKLNPFSTGAYVTKCVNDKLFLHCKFFKDDDDIDRYVGYVFHEIGWGGESEHQAKKRVRFWNAVRVAIKKRTNDNRQLCVDRWYIAA